MFASYRFPIQKENIMALILSTQTMLILKTKAGRLCTLTIIDIFICSYGILPSHDIKKGTKENSAHFEWNGHIPLYSITTACGLFAIFPIHVIRGLSIDRLRPTNECEIE
ncbi:hypothetical protein NPIL_461741 [Nephila pilipes]|uniref:Uncharacterized protein n=1 Tax=Nephila pilipes TaxID=299642 RepID=A0A8X6MB64_NEPPI|nr:hypothetical protein NPIL_94681 [Nephila pilipes]GFU02400.1 hypothetical protein NPIL_461741 [Nephila pilipes]